MAGLFNPLYPVAMPNAPAPADLSVAISASVDQETAGRMMVANKELMDHYGTRYIVTSEFPPHISLLLSGVAASAIPELTQLVKDQAKKQKTIKTDATRIDLDATGFLRTECEVNEDLNNLHRDLVEAFRVIHEKDPRTRTSDFSRWTELKFDDGRIVSDSFKPHLSIGWVDPDNASPARTLVESLLKVPFSIKLRTLDLVEVDQTNQLWRVIVSVPLGETC
jgi:hypothetical protein